MSECQKSTNRPRTLDVVTENLAMTLGTALSETLLWMGTIGKCHKIGQMPITFPPLPRPDMLIV